MLAAVLAASLALPAGLPKGLQIDGDLAEWSSRPVTIEQFHQVAGARHAGDEADFSAKVWIAFTKEGLAIAGEVRDDHVLFPTGEKDRLTADHVELWLAFPEMMVPQVRFDACSPQEGGGPSLGDCQAWMNDQASYVAYLHRLFIRQYSFSPLGIAEHFQAAPLKAYELPFEPRLLPAEARTVFRQTADGYTFEAFLPPAALPASARTPLASMSILVDFVDNDEGREKQETFLSSSPRRRFGDRSTFQTVKLAEPVLYESRVPLAVRRLAGHTGRFFFPAAEVDVVYLAVDPDWEEKIWPYGRRFHQPLLQRLRLTGQVLASWKGFSLELAADDATMSGEAVVPHYELMTVHEGHIAGFKALAARCQYGHEGAPIQKTITWERPTGLHAALFCLSPQSSAGRGACGSCTATEAEVVSVDAAGKIGRLYSELKNPSDGAPVALLGAGLAGTTFPANRGRLDSIDPEDRPSQKPLEWYDEQPAKIRFPKHFDFGLFYWDRIERTWYADFITWNATKKTYIIVQRRVTVAAR